MTSFTTYGPGPFQFSRRGWLRGGGWLVACLIASSSLGCSSGSLTRDLLSQQNDFARIECDCNWEEDGYDSASQCRSESTFSVPPQATACGDRALRADGTGEMVASTECVIAAGAVRIECERAAACDDVALTQCAQNHLAALAQCPQPSADAQAAFDAALQGCISGAGGGPVVNGCPDRDLGSATGASVVTASIVRCSRRAVSSSVTASTATGDNDLGGTCGGQQANDMAYGWTAPQSGTVTIDTFGSSYDTVLYVAEGTCESPTELACNDDEGFDLQSEVTVDVTAGDELIIVVDGFGGDDGRFVLNITY